MASLETLNVSENKLVELPPLPPRLVTLAVAKNALKALQRPAAPAPMGRPLLC
jgi:hypothetical protein